MKKELLHIKANGNYYHPQEPGIEKPNSILTYPVCYIKKRLFGIWQIDMYDEWNVDRNKGFGFLDEKIPNTRIYIYPSGIEEIKYKI